MKITKKIKTAFFLLLLITCYGTALAQQQFKYSAEVSKIDSSGFYRIDLHPKFIAASKLDLSDIRIVDGKNKFVPFIIGDKLPQRNLKSFINFAQVAAAGRSDTLTAFIIENNNRKSLDHLWLRMRNTAVSRTVNILGSENLNDWFAIKENVLLQETDAITHGDYEQRLDFPASTYKYIKIQVNGKNKTPISILNAGIYVEQGNFAEYNLISDLKFTQKDSGKVSYVSVKLPLAYEVDKLELEISGTKYFIRDVDVYELKGNAEGFLISTKIKSGQLAVIDLSARTKNLLLKISNEDNSPLKINTIKAYQQAQSLISYLEKNETYRLLVGNNAASAPNYDLASFTDSIYSAPIKISHGALLDNPLYKTGKVEPDKFPAWGIWVAVLAALAILLLLTLKMVKEINNKEAK